MTHRFRPAVGVAAVLLAASLLAGCAGGPAPEPESGAARPATLTPDERALAVRLHGRLEAEHAQGNDRAALRLGYELLDHYRGYERLEDVRLLAARSAVRLGEPDEALRLTADVLNSGAPGAGRRELLELRAGIHEADADWPRAADALVRSHAAAVLARDREATSDRLDALAVHLDADQLRALTEAHPRSALHPYLSYLWIRALVEEERGREARLAFGALQGESPADPWTAHAEQLLAGTDDALTPAPPGMVLPGDADPLQVGVLVPLTGRYTVLGNAFYDGVRLARDEANREGWRQYALSVRDSEGDPVTAALAVRRFMAEERPLALVGCLLSAPTVAASLTAEAFGVPLISPTATNLRIWELGPNTFQTNVTGLFESRLLARLVVGVMLKHRVAVLHPDDAEGLRRAQVFADAVLEMGGDVVALEAFNTGLTDFRDPLARIASSLPEAIYVPAGPDQMMILGPQLDFYRTGALVLGPSEWNSPRLAREIGTILTRAVFPSDAALYPDEWSRRFEARWDPGELPAEATAIARQAFLSSMLLFQTMGDSGAETRADLRRALGARLELRREVAADPDVMAASLRMFDDGAIVPFPMDLFRDALRHDAAVAAAAAADSLPAPTATPLRDLR